MDTNTPNTPAALPWFEACLLGARDACPSAAPVWLRAVATLAALDYADRWTCDEDEQQEPSDEEARQWGEHYASNVAEFPSGL